jgi:hypothetical protein
MTQRRIHFPVEVLNPRTLFREAIGRLQGIFLQVVQLGVWRLDVLEVFRPPCMKRRPSQLELGIERLGIGGLIPHLVPLGSGPERPAVDIAAPGKPGVVGKRWQHVDRSGDRPRHAPRGNPRSGHDPWHSQHATNRNA